MRTGLKSLGGHGHWMQTILKFPKLAKRGAVVEEYP